jgi:hypothetical protein
MSIFKDYEVKVLRILTSSVLSPGQLEVIVREGQFIDCKYTKSGYFLSVRHASLPEERIVCNEPIISGSVDNIICGFIIFIENRQITIECHSWEPVDVPPGMRDRNVQIAVT